MCSLCLLGQCSCVMAAPTCRAMQVFFETSLGDTLPLVGQGGVEPVGQQSFVLRLPWSFGLAERQLPLMYSFYAAGWPQRSGIIRQTCDAKPASQAGYLER